MTNQPPSRGRELALQLGVPILTLLVSLLYADPRLIGSLEDDGLYLSAARSLAHGAGLTVDLLPGAPHVAKHPILYPLLLSLPMRCGLDVSRHGALWVLLVIQAAILAAALAGFVNVLLPRAGFTRLERWLAFVLMLINISFLQVHTALMSEGPFLLLMTAQLILLDGIRPGDAREAPASLPASARRQEAIRATGLALLALLACLTRGVMVIVAAAYLPVLLWRRAWKAAALLVLGVVMGMGINTAIQHRAASPANDPIPAPPYYYSYSPHVQYYTAEARRHGFVAAARRVGGVVRANAVNGASSLKELFLPSEPTEIGRPFPATTSDAGVATGVAIFLLAAAGLASSRRTAALLPLLAVYSAFFLVWTWPFTGRFWILVLPLIVTGVVCFCRWLRRPGALALVVLTLGVTLAQGVMLAGHVAGRWQPQNAAPPAPPVADAPPSPEQAAQRRLDWLRANLSRDRGDTILGGMDTLWVARNAQVQGLWLEGLADTDFAIWSLLGVSGPPPITPGEADDRLWRNLLALRRRLPPSARLILQRDFTLAPDQGRCIEHWRALGRVRAIAAGLEPEVELYEVDAGHQ